MDGPEARGAALTAAGPRWTRGWRPWALLSLLCLGLYVPGLATIPPLDRDEARFVQATRQMLETGDVLRIRFQDEARNKKPVGIYWLQAAAVAVLGDARAPEVWPYRLPSVLGALAAVLLTFGLGAGLVGRLPAFLGAALLASSLALVAEAHIAKTDAALLATVVAAQGALGEAYRRAPEGGTLPWRWAMLFWLAQGCGILIKGPVTPLASLLTAVSLGLADRRWGWLRALHPAWGAPLMLLIAMPWFVLILGATGGDFARDALGHDLLGKLVQGQEGHGAPPGYYLLLSLATFWPASLFLGRAAAQGWRCRRDAPERFLLAWALPLWLLFEAVPTKLPHYVLPVYPALALLAARALVEPHPASPSALGGEGKSWRGVEIVVRGLWAAVGVALAAAAVAVPIRFGGGLVPAGVVAAFVILFFGWKTLGRAGDAGTPLALRAVVLALLAFPPILAFVAPRLDGLWLSRGAAAMVARHPPPGGAPVLAVGYSEPSLVFLLGTGTRLASPETAAAALAQDPKSVALVSDREDAAFNQALARQGAAAHALDRVAGLDYSNGRRLVLTLYGGASP